ncbi:MAG: DinB family protein [Gemmatimonadales bacterium]
MNSLEMLGQLYRHMEWADAAVWRAVLATPGAAGDADLRERLLHLHTTQHAFLSTWRARAFDREAGKAKDLPALARWTWEFHQDAAAYVASLHEADLDREHVVPWAARVSARLGREVAATTLRETLFQAAAHSHYHRGQVNTRLKQVGGTPPMVDFIAWVWTGKPPVEWPAEAR